MNALIRLLSLLAFVCVGFGAQAQTPKITMEEFMVPTADAGIQLYVRNKYPQGVKKIPGEKSCCSCMAQPIPPRLRST